MGTKKLLRIKPVLDEKESTKNRENTGLLQRFSTPKYSTLQARFSPLEKSQNRTKKRPGEATISVASPGPFPLTTI
jgi:hypothetical protein